MYGFRSFMSQMKEHHQTQSSTFHFRCRFNFFEIELWTCHVSILFRYGFPDCSCFSSFPLHILCERRFTKFFGFADNAYILSLYDSNEGTQTSTSLFLEIRFHFPKWVLLFLSSFGMFWLNPFQNLVLILFLLELMFWNSYLRITFLNKIVVFQFRCKRTLLGQELVVVLSRLAYMVHIPGRERLSWCQQQESGSLHYFTCLTSTNSTS